MAHIVTPSLLTHCSDATITVQYPIFIDFIMSEKPTPESDYKAGTPWGGVLEFVKNNGGLDEI